MTSINQTRPAPGRAVQPDPPRYLLARLLTPLLPFLHYGGADENAPLLVVVGIGVLIGIFLAWRRR